MLNLLELRFRNFRRFLDEQCVDAKSLLGFTQLDGKNNNTSGSSGSGKSTVPMALDYLLGVNHLPATILQCRYTEEPLWVQGVFEGFVITRSKGLIEIEKDGKTDKGKRAEEIIDQILGMPRELFRKVMHKRQKEGGFFLSFTPKEMHDFLIDCIGLSKFKEKYKILEDRIEYLEKQSATYEAQLTGDLAGLTATQDAILALGLAPIKDMHEEVIEDLKQKAYKSAIRFTDVEKDCESSYREFSKNRPSITNREYDATVREAAEKRRDEIEAAIEACFDRERERQELLKKRISAKELEGSRIILRIRASERAKTDAANLASEIKSIQAQLCPTCSQGWQTESASETLEKKLYTLRSLKTLIVDGTKAEEENVALADLLADLKSQLTPQYDPTLPGLNEDLAAVCATILEEKEKAGELYEQQNAETKRLLDEFGVKQGELVMANKLLTDQARGQMDVDRRVYDSALQKLKSYEEAKARHERTLKELESKANSLIEKTTKSREQVDLYAVELKKATESLRATKLYVSISFDEALNKISEKATKIIRCIPNMKNATIQFEGTKETQKGEMKEEVNAILSMDGEPTVPVKSLSGGEGSATDLAVDLAVIDFIESRSGMGINVFILDEPFNGLGTVEIEMALDVLKNSNTNKKLIIVDHNPEVKQMVQSRLVVERTGLTSRLA